MFHLRAPNGKLIIGTSETVPAVANVIGWTMGADGRPEPEWEGWTEIIWDGQMTERRDGQMVLVDEDGDEWLESEVTIAETVDEDDL